MLDCKKISVVLMSVLLILSGIPINTTVSANNDEIGFPEFTGPDNPVPEEPVPYTVDNMMQDIYDEEKDGTDFWMDRMLARHGDDPAGDWLMTRGRALFMKTHNPRVIGFGGNVAYWESIDDSDAYSIEVNQGNFTEDISQRLQTPSYWKSVFTNDDGIDIVMKKFITDANVAVTNLDITNNNSSSEIVELTASSPYTTKVEGNELTGQVDAYNDLTTIYPRLSGDDLTVDGEKLTGAITVGAGETVSTKVAMGFVTEEISNSLDEYNEYLNYTPDEAFSTHVRVYNKWWADNLPYIDVPDDNIKKQIYYRWWLMRYNYLDANIPGNDYQFPTSMEGVLGYNNSIVLTTGMFIQDLKYLRDPMYSYGPWVSAGEVSRNDKYTDNPGDPENWSNSYTQYLTESAWESYQIHGGQKDIINNLARYGEKDVYGQLEHYDKNDNYVISYDWGSMVGNDADAVSFHYYGDQDTERTEGAYVYGNAKATSEMYNLLGNNTKAAQMQDVANNIQNGILDLLWNEEDKLFEHKDVETGNLIPWKEINNYYPFAEGLVPNTDEYKESLRLWQDASEYPIFPFYTANQADKAEAAAEGKPGTNNFSVINSTVNFRLFGEVIRNYPTEYITEEMYKKLLYWNAWAHFIDGNTQYPDANEFWADWNEETQQIDYRSWIHHTILGSSNWTIIEDIAGLRPRTDDKVELHPIDIGWDHFTINNLNYRNNDMTIIWDKPDDGETHYEDAPEGYSIYINGGRMVTIDSLVHFIWDPETGEITFPEETGTVLLNQSNTDMKAPEEVVLEGNRIVDMFQKAGVDLTETGDTVNLALGTNTNASYTDSETNTSAAVDGFTINQPIWGSEGSGNAKDWYEIDFGEETTFDDVRLYFYNDRSDNGYSEPSMYLIQYHNGDKWVTVPNQFKNEPYPLANYNKVKFPSITTDKMRVLMTHKQEHSTGLKEVQVYNTEVSSTEPTNVAPKVTAKQDTNFKIPLQAKLLGNTQDDGLPSGTLDGSWSLVSGPGTVNFADENAMNTTATFSEAGTYDLQFEASDGELSASDEITVTVDPIPEKMNVALDATPSASYTSGHEDVEAINDGIDPPRSNDTQNPRHGTWPQEGTQWVQLDWEYPVKVDEADVYFFDDNGGVRVPSSWKIQYWDGESFVDVENPSEYGTEIDQYNSVTFDPVTTNRLRLVMESGGASVGILEWKNYSDHPVEVKPVHIPTLIGEQPDLPSTVQKIYEDGSVLEANVDWGTIDPEQLEDSGTSFTITGIVDGTYLEAEATVYVRETNEVSITSITEEDIRTLVGVHPVLPLSIKATYNDGSVDNVNTSVTWESIDPSQYEEPGTFTVTGQVDGTTLEAKTNVTVIADSEAKVESELSYTSDSIQRVNNLSLSGKVMPESDNGSLDELPVQFKVYKMNSDGTWSEEPVKEKVVETDEEGLVEYNPELEPGYYQVKLDLLENSFYTASRLESEIVVYDPDVDKSLKANGHIDVGNNFGESTKKLHLQSNLGYNEDGITNGHLRVNATPKGLNLDVSVEWMAIGVDNTYVQGTGNDGEKSYTIRIILNHDGQALSIVVWEGEDTSSEPLHELYDQPFRGSINY